VPSLFKRLLSYGWRFISATILLAVILWLVYINLEKTYIFHWSQALNSLHNYNEGLKVTLTISLISMFVSMVLGIIIAIGRLSRWTIVRDLSGAFVNSLRNLPFIVVILLFYFGLRQAVPIANLFAPWRAVEVWGIPFFDERFIWGVLALSIFESSFIAEIFRGGIQAIHKEQMESARSLGMTYFQSMRYVILPQAFRVIIPPLTNELVALVKESSLLFIISLEELTQTAKLQYSTGRPYVFEYYTILAVYYLMLTIPLSILSHFLERRLAVGDQDRRRA
jgi:polar amino acid transport system permease protein